jgi:hypothetical protein
VIAEPPRLSSVRLHRGDDTLNILQGLKTSKQEDLEVRNQLGWFYLANREFGVAATGTAQIYRIPEASTTARSFWLA